MFYLMYEKDEQGNNKDVRVDAFPVASGKHTPNAQTTPARRPACPRRTSGGRCPAFGRRWACFQRLC
jgi:hypothetical protein